MLTKDVTYPQTSEEYYLKPQDVGINEFLNTCTNASPDDDVWYEFYRRFDPYVRNFVRRALLVRNQQPTKEKIEDLVQDVYTAIFRLQSIDKFKGTHENIFFGYLSIISINVVRLRLQNRRAIKRRAYIVPLDVVKCDATRCFDPEEDRIAEVATKELIERLEYLFKPRDVEIFLLYAMEGYNAQDLTSYGIKRSTVYGIVKNIRKRMREIA